MFFKRSKIYEMDEDNFKYIANAKVRTKVEIDNFAAFLKTYNKCFSNNQVRGEIKREDVDNEITEFTYEISVNKRYILNSVFFDIMHNHLGMISSYQEGYCCEYLRVKNLITSTCNKVNVFKEINFDEENLNLTNDEQVIYHQLFNCVDKIVDEFYGVTFEGALLNMFAYDF